MLANAWCGRRCAWVTLDREAAAKPVCGERVGSVVILVTTGTNCPPFDRLVGAVETLGGREDIVVQHGPCTIRPRNAKCVEYLSFPELVRLICESRCVVTH